MKKLVSILLSLSASSLNAATLYSENFGSPSGTTAIAAYTGYQNTAPITYTVVGNAPDIRSTSASSGYPTASGAGNVFFTTSSPQPRGLEIAGINTTTISPGMVLEFGIRKESGTGSNADMTLEYSTDGTNYTASTYTTLGGAAGWYYVTAAFTVPSASNLRLRFNKNSTTNAFRLDDIRIGDPTGAVTPTQALNIAAVKNSADASIFLNTSGTVTSVGGSFGRLQFTIQDATGGIIIDRNTAVYTQPNVGDFVNILSGTKTTFNGLVELQPTNGSDVVTTPGGGSPITPQAFASVAAFLASTTATQSNLVRIPNVFLSDLPPANSGATTWLDGSATSANIVYGFSDGGPTTVSVRLASDLHNTTATWQAKTRPVEDVTADKVDIVTVAGISGSTLSLIISDPVGTTAKTDATGPIRASVSAVRDWKFYDEEF